MRNPRYVAVLAIVSVCILVSGWFGRPRDIPEAPTPAPSETELEQLARRAERRSLEGMTRYFDGVSREAALSMVRITDADVSGIVWDERRIVVPTLDAPPGSGGVLVANGSNVSQARPAVWGPNLPVAALLLSQRGNRLPARRAAALPAVGGWVVAVWTTDAGPAFAAGNFHQQATLICADLPIRQMSTSVALHRAMLGGGLFDIEGNLLGIVADCHSRLAVIAADAVAPLIGRDSVEQRLIGSYGIVVGPLSAEEEGYFKTGDGLLVREVWTGSDADVAGLWPGDLVLTINGQAVTSPADLTASAASEAPVHLVVRRGRTTMPIQLRAGGGAANSEATGAEGVTWDSVPRRFTIDAVRPGSREQRAGLQPRDQLLRIDHAEPRTLDHVKRRLRGASPILLEVARERRRLAILVR
jgi:S1-C subfamily serine protease